MSIQQKIDSLNSQIKELNKEKETLEKELFFEKLNNSDKGKAALELFNKGYRLVNWGASLTDTNEEIILKLNNLRIGYWADSSNRDTQEIYSKLNLNENEFNEEVLEILCDLSER